MKENVEKRDRLSINQIKRRYINEWVLLVDPDISNETLVRTKFEYQKEENYAFSCSK